MKRILLFTISCFLYLTGFSQLNQKSVLYGERDSILESEGLNFFRLFIDKNGDYYPDFFIPDNELKNSNSELLLWSKQNQSKFIKIAEKYGLNFQSYSKQNFKLLQTEIIRKLGNEIKNQSSNFNSISVLIHGFRKPFKERQRSIDSWSYDDNEYARNIINNNLNKTFFLEIYWDGAYDCCITKKTRKNKKIFKLFENYATPNAIKTGYSLRRIISKLSTSKLNIISHSTGAIVSSTLLFNAYQSEIEDNFKSLSTPNQKAVNHCLLAPAISKEPFNFYFDRNTTLEFKENDNYKLVVIYNEKDFVLLKKEPYTMIFGPGPKKYGITTLGCNHKKEVKKLKKLFKTKYPNSIIDTKEIGPLKSHLLTFYTNSNNKAFINWLKELK